VTLRDGSFVSCSYDGTAKRWIISGKNNSNGVDVNCGTIQLAGTFVGHGKRVTSAIEKDDNNDSTLVTSGETHEAENNPQWEMYRRGGVEEMG